MSEAESSAVAPSRVRRLSIGAVVVLALVVFSAAVGLGIMRGQAAPAQTVPLTDAAAGVSGELYVHVLGEVQRPGLYILDLDARLVDALAAAGGTTETADLRAVNLARTLTDGEQIIVPAVGTEEQGDGEGSGTGADGLIDLNNADQAELETLPRIGPALAARIISWRDENARFRSVDDLLAVPGIGEKLLASLRDLVRV